MCQGCTWICASNTRGMLMASPGFVGEWLGCDVPRAEGRFDVPGRRHVAGEKCKEARAGRVPSAAEARRAGAARPPGGIEPALGAHGEGHGRWGGRTCYSFRSTQTVLTCVYDSSAAN